MIRIEVIGLEPPCPKCNELLDNAKQAAKDAGIEAEHWLSKVWSLPRERYINRNESPAYFRVPETIINDLKNASNV